MRFPHFTAAVAALCLALPTAAQKTQTMAFSGSTAATTLAVFAQDFSFGYLATITHGQPDWKAEYDGMMDKLKGKLHRLGKNNFTTFASNADVEFGGVKVAAGSYVVGLNCDKDGKFALALMDASKAMKAGLAPFTPQTWTPDLLVPVTFNKDAAPDSVAKMTMTFTAAKEGDGKGTFTLAWGKHTLTAPIVVQLKK